MAKFYRQQDIVVVYRVFGKGYCRLITNCLAYPNNIILLCGNCPVHLLTDYFSGYVNFSFALRPLPYH